MPRFLYFLGTAGSGKTTLVAAFKDWMAGEKYDALTVNLDPGAEVQPEKPEVDIRDWVTLEEVMREQGLGPNGAQVACADLVGLHAREVVEVLEKFETDYVLVDTPGQLELFAFREASRMVIDAFGREDAFLVFLSDAALVRRPSGLVASYLLSATVQYRHALPFLNVLSKADLLLEEELKQVLGWSNSPMDLMNALYDAGTPEVLLNVEFLKGIEEIGVYRRLTPVSSAAGFGMEDIYSTVQQTFEGGEDLTRR